MRRLAVIVAGAAVALAGLVAVATPGNAQGSDGALDAVLVGGNEAPGPGDAEGFGIATVRVDEAGEVCWRITHTGIGAPAAAHIHGGPRGVAGPVVVELDPVNSGCTDTTRRIARTLWAHPSQFYVNVHTAEFPDGAIRGQLLR